MVILIILQALYSVVSITNKQLLCYCHPFVLAGFRMTVASSALVCVAMCKPQLFSGLSMRYAPLYAYLVVCGVYVKYSLKYWGLSNMSTVKMSCLFSCTPFMMAGISWILLRERISCWQGCGL